MCLGPDFFDAREEAERLREAEGAIEVCRFLEERQVDFDLLYDLGYFETTRDGFCTADLFIHDVPPVAERFFLQDKDLQLIFVLPEWAEELASRLRQGTPATT